MATPIKLTLDINGKTKTITVDVHVLAHMFTCHSLGLHDWEKKERQKLIDHISEHNERDDTFQRVGWYHDAVDDIKERRRQSDIFESAMKELNT